MYGTLFDLYGVSQRPIHRPLFARRTSLTQAGMDDTSLDPITP